LTKGGEKQVREGEKGLGQGAESGADASGWKSDAIGGVSEEMEDGRKELHGLVERCPDTTVGEEGWRASTRARWVTRSLNAGGQDASFEAVDETSDAGERISCSCRAL
jgi:hypothetical protein